MMYEYFLLERYHKTHEMSPFRLYVFFKQISISFLNLTVNPFSDSESIFRPLTRVGRWDEGYESFSFPFINGGAFCCSAFSTKSPGVTFDILLKAIGYI